MSQPKPKPRRRLFESLLVEAVDAGFAPVEGLDDSGDVGAGLAPARGCEAEELAQ